jgi:competence protein ComFA
MNLLCERCGCTDPKYFVSFQGKDLCRRCISYQGNEGKSLSYEEDVVEQFNFELTHKQKEVSEAIYQASHLGNVLVYAVCGSGKSELVVQTISQYLSAHKKVGITIARKQVVLELKDRYQSIFPHLKVTAVCEGHTDDLVGELIICTTHQLYRFHKQFDCLIIDEPDAYPYHSDEVLQGFAKQACCGVKLYLTATPDEKVRKDVKSEIQLFRRPHNYPLPVPKLIKVPLIFQLIWLKYQSFDKPTLIFVPSIKQGKLLSKLLNIKFVYANQKDLSKLIKQFKENRINPLLCTTVLERGVTFKNVQVIVLEAQHPVFTLATLIQIAGRVGRSVDYPTGDVHFLCSQKSESINQCIKQIQNANSA